MTNNNKECDIIRGDGDPKGFHRNIDTFVSVSTILYQHLINNCSDGICEQVGTC